MKWEMRVGKSLWSEEKVELVITVEVVVTAVEVGTNEVEVEGVDCAEVMAG
jgi:hypothetical protein